MQAGKPVVLLTYLALAPRGRAARDHVADLFWPGSSPSDARHSLRQAIYRVRRATGGVDLIGGDDSCLALSAGVRLDCLEAEVAMESDDLERAYQLLRAGDFLAGIAHNGSRDLEEWAEAQRSRFRDIRARVTRRLARGCLEKGDTDRAVKLSEELLSLRPFDDAAMELLMRALTGRGKHATALARFHAFAELLASELEEEPAAELAAFARELDEYLKSKPERVALELPLVGRTDAWSALEAAWDGTQRGQGAIVLLEGAAGMGKSRLLRELRHRVDNGDSLILPAKCYEIESGVPYSAVAEVFSGAIQAPELAKLSGVWVTELARVLPGLRERFPHLPRPEDGGFGPAAHRRLHEAFARTASTLSQERRLLLSIDDLHWADAASLELLHLLSHRLQESRALLVATYRPADLTPAARRFARSLCSSRATSLITLEPLTFEEVRELVRDMARFDDSAAEGMVVSQLHHHSAGNPLHLSELVEALARDRVLWIRGSCWQLGDGPSIDTLPNTLSKLLVDRIDALPTGMKSILEALAVAGDELEVETLAGALDLSEPKAELALSVLEEERLVRRLGQSTFELIHDELRHLIYNGIPDARRALVHGALARALEAQGAPRRPGGPARLAFHFDLAGAADEAHRYAMLAAGEAEAFSAGEAARRHLELAASHSPRALPPVASAGSAPGSSGWRRLLDRHAVRAAAAVLLLGGLVGAAIGRAFLAPSGPAVAAPPYQQGRIYLSQAGLMQATHVLEWPASAGELGRIVELPEHPSELPLNLASLNVSAEGESHPKLFRIEGTDTVQLTFGKDDDYFGTWSPDQRFIALYRGWRSSDDRYTQNIFLIDPTTGRILERVTNTEWQDNFATWSPFGGSLAFARDSAGIWSIWITDADGRHAENVSRRFDLPASRAIPSFSPDGKRLAVSYPDTGNAAGALSIVDSEERVSYTVPIPEGVLAGQAQWSPDGRWVAYTTKRADGWALWMSDVNGSSRPKIVAVVESYLQVSHWTDGVSRHVEHIDLELTDELVVGTGVRANARALTPAGVETNAPIRWSALDEEIASVDGLGFMRGRSPGRTFVVASLGGILADTVPLEVRAAPTDTLFHEDWSAGLDTTTWTPFGFPEAFVAMAPEGRSALLNNGDYNHTSGVYSNTGFRIDGAGLTLTVQARLPFDGGFWQFITLGFLTEEPDADDQEMTSARIVLTVHGGSPTVPGPTWNCGASPVSGKLNRAELAERWRLYAVQLRPDGYMECWLDGQLLARTARPFDIPAGPVFAYLDGQMENTRLYHGEVVVSRGLRY
jgi:DNA-binding SARP family transcriptional activator